MHSIGRSRKALDAPVYHDLGGTRISESSQNFQTCNIGLAVLKKKKSDLHWFGRSQKVSFFLFAPLIFSAKKSPLCC